MDKIRLKTLEEALDELEKLERASSIVTLGEWSYPKILRHLRFFLEGSMSGFPESRSSFIRTTVGPNLLRNIKQIGYMPSGFRNSFLLEDSSAGNSGTELIKLRDAIRTFMDYRGKLADHPIYGSLTREDWNLVHAYHIANHLSFLKYGKSKSIKKSASASKKKPSVKKTASKKTKKSAPKKTAKKGRKGR